MATSAGRRSRHGTCSVENRGMLDEIKADIEEHDRKLERVSCNDMQTLVITKCTKFLMISYTFMNKFIT